MEIDLSNVANVISITVITYCAGLGINASNIIDEKWIPFIVGVMGGILGIVGYNIIPNYPANDIMDAISVGIVSGLASTGVHQVYKQVIKK